MTLMASTLALIRKEIKLELRQKYAISGILMYMFSVIIIIFFTFEQVQGPVWITLFWIIILFTAVNAVAKSFLQDGPGMHLYLYTLASPQSIILAKIIYNILILLFLSLLALIFYILIAGFPVVDDTSFFLALLLGAISFASVFSMMSAIASKASNSGTLMAILSFPVLIPILKILIRISLQAITVNEPAVNVQDILYLSALNIFIIAFALVLFPYLWRD